METTHKNTKKIYDTCYSIYELIENTCDIDLRNEGIDLLDYDIDSLCDYINESNLLDVDIIYYHKAMKYLMENDTSLCESMELAQDLGYEPKDIDSELLASLHATKENKESFYGIQGELEKLFDKLEEIK